MKKIANIGFIISLLILSASIPVNIWACSVKPSISPPTGDSRLWQFLIATLILIGVTAVLWIYAVRNLVYYRLFVHFKDESVQKITGEIDTALIADLYEREVKKVNK